MSRLKEMADSLRTMDSQTRLRALIIVATIALLLVAWSEGSSRIAKLEKKRVAREKDLQEMMILSARYKAAKAGAAGGGRMAAIRPDDTLGKIVDDIGIRGKSLQVRPLKGEDKPGRTEELGEIRVDGLTLNEAVNLIYKLEKGPKPVVIRKSLVKSRFDDPSKVDVTLTAALLKPAAKQ